MTRLSGRITPRVIASRSSATFLPEKSRLRAVEAAVSPALRAPLAACCWRARALPPALAARFRAAVLRVLEPERRLVELPDPERALDLRAVEPELRELALDLRAPDPELRELELLLRELELLLRDDPPLDDLLRDDDDPLPLPLFDSAIPFLLRSLSLHARCAPHYRMPKLAVT
jgi:hypothetical protein